MADLVPPKPLRRSPCHQKPAGSRFLNLPREVRDKIYDEVLVFDKPIAICQLGSPATSSVEKYEQQGLKMKRSDTLVVEDSKNDDKGFREDLLRQICDEKMDNFDADLQDKLRQYLAGDKTVSRDIRRTFHCLRRTKYIYLQRFPSDTFGAYFPPISQERLSDGDIKYLAVPTALFRVNQQLRAEALPMFFNNNTFTLKKSSMGRTFSQYPRRRAYFLAAAHQAGCRSPVLRYLRSQVEDKLSGVEHFLILSGASLPSPIDSFGSFLCCAAGRRR